VFRTRQAGQQFPFASRTLGAGIQKGIAKSTEVAKGPGNFALFQNVIRVSPVKIDHGNPHNFNSG
jgi:hypothetical protein